MQTVYNIYNIQIHILQGLREDEWDKDMENIKSCQLMIKEMVYVLQIQICMCTAVNMFFTQRNAYFALFKLLSIVPD